MLSIERKKEIITDLIGKFQQQGRLSKGPSGSCNYRSLDGTRCAIGMLIKDEFYDERIEGIAVIQANRMDCISEREKQEVILLKQIIEESGYPIDEDSIRFYRVIQECHDNESSIEGCISSLEDVRNHIGD